MSTATGQNKLKGLERGRAYGFRYENHEDGTDYCRLVLEAIEPTPLGVSITGMDLNTSLPNRWFVSRIKSIEPIEVTIVPRRVYHCKWGRRDVALLVWSCFPTDDGDYRITGKINGEFAVVNLSELSEIQGDSATRSNQGKHE